jgi:hypothetical protein
VIQTQADSSPHATTLLFSGFEIIRWITKIFQTMFLASQIISSIQTSLSSEHFQTGAGKQNHQHRHSIFPPQPPSHTLQNIRPPSAHFSQLNSLKQTRMAKIPGILSDANPDTVDHAPRLLKYPEH